MIKVTAQYPNIDGGQFDIAYYAQAHMPMVRALLGSAIKHIEVECGLTAGAPGSTPAFVAAGHLYFESLEAFHAAFAPHAEAIRADIANYTDIKPQVQIGQIVSVPEGEDEVSARI